jgi:hypothetical protein
MVLTLTVWQKKKSGHPTRAAEGRLEDPTEESFDAAVAHLLNRVDPAAQPFQIVAQVGDSSRGFQLGQGWSEVRIKEELWAGYRTLAKTNG